MSHGAFVVWDFCRLGLLSPGLLSLGHLSLGLLINVVGLNFWIFIVKYNKCLIFRARVIVYNLTLILFVLFFVCITFCYCFILYSLFIRVAFPALPVGGRPGWAEAVVLCSQKLWRAFVLQVGDSLWTSLILLLPSLVVDVNNLKNGRKPVKLKKESPAGCAWEGKQNKGN